MKLYTKRGDGGFTSLLGTLRVRKDDSRVEAVGAVDELNSLIGHALHEASRVGHETICNALAPVQDDLFTIGVRVAALGAGKSPREMNPDVLTEMECKVDAICAALPPLTHFILPGGCELACRLHVCRAACRRAERAVVHLLNPLDEEYVHDPLAMQYLNRLGDLLFAAARLANHNAGVPEQPWPAIDAEGR